MAIGVVVFAAGVLIISLAVSFAITLLLERLGMISHRHRGRWILIIAPLALALVGILGWVFI